MDHPDYERSYWGNRLTDMRPAYHFMPPEHGATDVQAIFWNGEYHLFYDYFPGWPLSGSIAWGHASSRDLVHWRHHPVAIAPTPDTYDNQYIATGSIVIHNGIPTAFYTGGGDQAQCMATSRDLIHWEKYAHNPVVTGPPEGFDKATFRDPCVWQEADGWYMAVGGGIAPTQNVVLLYHSKDLIHWTFLHPLFTTGPLTATGTAGMFECPDFFPMGDRHVLLASVDGTTYWFKGRYEVHRLIEESHGRTDFGGLYAAKTLIDARGRRILWGSICESTGWDLGKLTGWSGVYCLPRVMALRDDGEICFSWPEELLALRGASQTVAPLNIIAGKDHYLPGIEGRQLEIECEIDPGTATRIGLAVRCSPADSMADYRERTIIWYERADGQLHLDRSKTDLFKDTGKTSLKAPLKLASGEKFRLRVFLDASMLEIQAGPTCWMTARIYPYRKDSVSLALTAEGGNAILNSMTVWNIKPERHSL